LNKFTKVAGNATAENEGPTDMLLRTRMLTLWRHGCSLCSWAPFPRFYVSETNGTVRLC